MSSQPFKYSITEKSTGSFSIRKKTIDSGYRLHWHDCCELELIVSGRGSQLLNDTEYPLLPGTLYMLTEADCHSIKSDEPLTIIGIMFDEKLISRPICERILTCESLGGNLTARLEGRELDAVTSLAEALMCEELNSDAERDFKDTFVGHIIDCILIELLRSCESMKTPPQSARADLLGGAILYLHSHYTEPVTLSSLAEHSHLSPSYFSELFRQYTGTSFKSYLISLRLKNACRLLANTDMSVTDICYASGFESFSNFMRTFKAHLGLTPLVFRRTNKGEQTNANIRKNATNSEETV